MKYFLNCLLIIATANVFSQNTLKGNIKDKQTNSSIAFANVYFPELEKGTISDEQGSFEFSNLPNGNYKLVVSDNGHNDKAPQP